MTLDDAHAGQNGLDGQGQPLDKEFEPELSSPDTDLEDQTIVPVRKLTLEKEFSSDNEITRQVSRPLSESLSPFHEFLFVGLICTAQLTTQCGFGQALIILHDIGRSFNLSNGGELSWLVAGYSLTVGTFILVSGRLGDMFGYKRMLIIGYLWFSLWSMIAGLAVYSNHVLFVFARVFQGIGPAILLPNALALLGVSYANGSPRKDMVFAFFGACAPGESGSLSHLGFCKANPHALPSQAARSSAALLQVSSPSLGGHGLSSLSPSPSHFWQSLQSSSFRTRPKDRNTRIDLCARKYGFSIFLAQLSASQRWCCSISLGTKLRLLAGKRRTST